MIKLKIERMFYDPFHFFVKQDKKLFPFDKGKSVKECNCIRLNQKKN